MGSGADATRARGLHWFIRGGYVSVPGGQKVRVGISTVTVGREPSCDVVVDDPEVSAAHCELRADGPGVLLRDLDSRNGTIVNGLRLKEGTLTQPCTIQIGGTRLAFEPLERERVDVGFEENFGNIVGSAPKMRHLFRLFAEISPTELWVLINGETGTGKELAAQAIHENSARANGPFVVVDCASIPGSLAEAQLFGHERGAFTGANERRAGAFHEANKGTIFLDELGELPIDLQPKLLRALAEKKIRRIGSNTYEPIDVRVIAATRRNLAHSMNNGQFRSDLFFRLAQVRIELPPLRERREDIGVLVAAVCRRIGRPERTDDVTHLVTTVLAQHDWPGNVRELVNVASVAASLPQGAEALASLLPLERGTSYTPPILSPFGEAKRAAVSSFEQGYFNELARATSGNVSEMARQSGMERHHVRAFLKKYGISVK